MDVGIDGKRGSLCPATFGFRADEDVTPSTNSRT
jgi:hypothetical protein